MLGASKNTKKQTKADIKDRLLSLALASTVFTSIVASDARAEDLNKEVTVSLNTVTVVATRTEQNILDVPAQVSVIETERAGNSVITDVQDLFKDTPSVQMTGGPRSNGQDFTMRGFDTNSILKLIDGTRLNYESAHDGQFFIDPRILKKVEVVRGASSSIYGGGAMGGVVAFETKDASDYLKNGETSGYQLGLDYRSANSLLAPSVTAFQRVGDFDIIGNLNYTDSGDIEQGGSNELGADDKIFNGLAKVKWFADDYSTFTASFIGYNGDNDEEPNNGTSPVNTTDNFESKKDVEQYITKLGYEYNPESEAIDLRIQAYYNFTDVEETVNDGGSNQGRVSNRELNTFGFNIDNISRFGEFENGNSRHTLSYGIEYYEDEQEAERVSATGTASTVPGTPQGESLSYGAYVQDEISLLDDRLKVIPAIRYDYFETEQSGAAGTERDDDEFSPKISAIYDVNDNVSIFGSAAQAFRAPKVTELYPSGIHFPRFIGFPPTFIGFNTFLPNPGLKPETSDNFEVGASFDFTDVFVGEDELIVKSSFYKTRAEDFISQSTSINGGANTQYLNADKAEIHGFEVDAAYNSESFFGSVGVAYSRAEDISTNSYLSESQPLTLVTNIGYKLCEKAKVGWRATFAKRTNNVPQAEQRSGYGVHDIYGEYTPEIKGLEGIKLNASVTNIFDKEYTPNFSSLLEEGRSFNFGVTYTVKFN